MKIKVVSKREKPFKGDEGEMVPYFWYRLIDADGIEREAGSMDGSGVVDETYLNAELVKVERRNGKIGWKIASFGE